MRQGTFMRSAILKTCASALVMALVSWASTAQAQVVATLDLEKVLNNCPQKVKFETETQLLQQQMKQDFDARQQEVQRLQSSLQEISKDAPEYTEKQDELTLAAINVQAYQQYLENRLRRESMAGFVKLINTIQSAVQAVAEQTQIDIVIQYRPPNTASLQNQEQLQQYLTARTVIYSSANADITDLVLQHLALMNQ